MKIRCHVLLAVLLWPLLQAASVAEPLQKKVLIIGVDGTRLDALAVARTPNIHSLKAGGCFSDHALTHPVTHSAACWSSFFTGVWGDKHGVNDPGNSFAGNQFASFPNFLRRLELGNSNWSTVAFTRWADVRNVLGGVDAVTNFSSDAALTTATCRLLTNGNPDVFFTILLDVDSTGHSSGWGASVSNYVLAIETADARIGQMMSALTSRTNRLHMLETSASLTDWQVVGTAVSGNGATLALSDPNPPAGHAFYRIRCQRP